MNVHIVQKGDTLWKIARQNGVSFDELKRMNAHLANPDYIVPGMKIFLPDKATGKKEEIVHPFNDGKPPKTVVLSEKEKVVEMPVMETPKMEVPVVELPKEKVVVKEKMIETPPMPKYSAPVQPTPIPQPIQMPHYHAIQYVPITKNFYSVQQSAHVQPAPVQPAPIQPPPTPVESPMVEEIVEEHVPMEMPMMTQPYFTGPMCGCMPMPEFCPPVIPCHPFMHHFYPMAPMPMPYYGSPIGMQGMPGMMTDQMMPGMMPQQMVQGVYEEEMSPNFSPEQMMGNYPVQLPEMETPEVAGQMAVNPGPAGWVLESPNDEPSSFLEKYEQQYQHQTPGQVAGAYGYPATGQVAGAYGYPATGQAAGAYGYPAPGQVAGAYAPPGATMYPDYYGLQQGYPMAAAPYGYNPYMMPGQYGYGPGPCNCY
ncbi:SafA/ExsA family spore coat assembly protein [Chungangia koreensis]|uniref:SafA/ExsA family spore coat assembly protein n=1 Tax=Chungangia koreensis TaxID=752657 RepID=A0ABV8X335_9LACT